MSSSAPPLIQFSSLLYLPAEADSLVSHAGNTAWLWQHSLTFFCSSPGGDLLSGWSQLDGVSSLHRQTQLLRLGCCMLKSSNTYRSQWACCHVLDLSTAIWHGDGSADWGQHPRAAGSWQIDSFSWIEQQRETKFAGKPIADFAYEAAAVFVSLFA